MRREEFVAELDGILLRRRAALRHVLREDLNLLVHEEDEDEPHDDDILSCLAEAEDHQLAAIDRALARIRDGKFGRCESCNRQIPLARLKALPFATYCVGCQRKMDLVAAVPS